MDTVSSASRVCFFDATMGFGWDGFKQRERPYETSEIAAHQMPPIVDEHLIGNIPHDLHDAALHILRTCPVKSDERWNCQDWVRECISLLDEAGAITKPSSEVKSVWNDGTLARRDTAMPGK